MGRIYSAAYNGTLTNAGGDSDLLECLPADDKPVRLLGFSLSQISAVADAGEEGLRITVQRMTATVTSGSGGSSVTPAPADGADTAFGGTVECNNSTVATTSGSTVVLAELGWNVRNTPFDFWFPERAAPKARQGEGLFVRCQTTVSVNISIQVTFWLEEE